MQGRGKPGGAGDILKSKQHHPRYTNGEIKGQRERERDATPVSSEFQERISHLTLPEAAEPHFQHQAGSGTAPATTRATCCPKVDAQVGSRWHRHLHTSLPSGSTWRTGPHRLPKTENLKTPKAGNLSKET